MRLSLLTTPLLLGLLAACSEGGGAAAPQSPKKAAPPVLVQVASVEKQPLRRSLNAVGSLESNESVTIAAEVAGRVSRIGFAEGQPVARGTVLIELDDILNRAELAQAQANLALAERNDRRAGEIAQRGLIAASERDSVAAALAVNRAAVQMAQAKLAKMRILAPIAGVAGLRTVAVGDYVSPGQALVNLEAMNPMKLDFRLPESALPLLAPGQKLQAEVDAYPGERFAGEVYAIDPRIADSSRSIAVRARLENAGGRLKPGLFARVQLETSVREDALVVPEQAVFPQGEQLFVYVIADAKAELRTVKVGQREPGRAEITEGLKAGEQVAVAGLQKLSPGASVQLQAGAEPPSSGGDAAH
ncbi:efflux RND transporter periplasmic adaptor subunit [Stagnimonas aquatica]|uniref:Efflux RND transporter periplasmic adaptor subunit n=1 Tax=Stagnimonas aquatica TaxID=2689987 RepID=A0A3N0VAC8_9GAMM|nr:efflux RND transporter periplasmic adaptor subunit [Stagnimonas aquatica]ROH89564.1 efflux RND transporter periplasmic adaptor subunit [Stagnimonas aquatica]